MSKDAAQPYRFGIADTAIALYGGVGLDRLHWDAEAILRAFDATRPAAERLGIPPPAPRLAGFSYGHLSALGSPITFPPDSEPVPHPCINSPEDIDRLHPPADYLSAGINPDRLKVRDELNRLRPGLNAGGGLGVEGPVTTAALLMGPDFFTLPYDDPERAHRLLEFVTDSAVDFVRAQFEFETGRPWQSGPRGICDDFAGMFPPNMFEEFVLPYWDGYYRGLEATTRHLHSELLRPEHLHYLEQLEVRTFDPSADQYVTPEILSRDCPCPFQLRIQSWHIRDLTPEELIRMYRRLAGFRPAVIAFYMTWPSEEEKMAAILSVAREMA